MHPRGWASFWTILAAIAGALRGCLSAAQPRSTTHIRDRRLVVGEVRGGPGHVSVVRPQDGSCIRSFELEQRPHVLRHRNVAQREGGVGPGES